MDLHISDSYYLIVQIPGSNTGTKKFLCILILFKKFHAFLRNLVDKVFQSKVIQSHIFLPIRKLDLQHFNISVSDSDCRIVVDLDQVIVDLLNIIFHELYNSLFFSFHNRNIHFQFLHKAVK